MSDRLFLKINNIIKNRQSVEIFCKDVKKIMTAEEFEDLLNNKTYCKKIIKYLVDSIENKNGYININIDNVKANMFFEGIIDALFLIIKDTKWKITLPLIVGSLSIYDTIIMLDYQSEKKQITQYFQTLKNFEKTNVSFEDEMAHGRFIMPYIIVFSDAIKNLNIIESNNPQSVNKSGTSIFIRTSNKIDMIIMEKKIKLF